MRLKKKLLKKSCLYAVIDKETTGKKGILDKIRQLKGIKADIIQLRDKISKKETVLKDARAIKKILLNSDTIFIVNDYIDIARLADSDGIHLGQRDLPVDVARKILGNDKIIGISCHSLKQAIDAQNKGADYISLGPIFPTPTKPEYPPVGLGIIKKIKEKITIPFFVIGGIEEGSISKVMEMGAMRAAVCRAVCKTDNAAFSYNKLKGRLK